MTKPSPRITAALTGAAVLISAAGLLAAGCGSTSDSGSDTSTVRAAAATQEVTLNATPPQATKAQAVSSAVGDTVIYSVACKPGDVWKSLRNTPLITKTSPDLPTSKECVDGTRKWAFVNTAAGTQEITFNGTTAQGGSAEGSLKRAAVELTVSGPEPKELALEVTAADVRPAGQDVTLAVGDTLVVTAECNPGAGDDWNSVLPLETPPVIVRSTTLVFPRACVAPDGAPAGAPGQYQWAFEAKGPGTVRVAFRKKDPSQKLLARGAVNVTVQ